jgi:dihydroneopterin aldolase
MQEITLRAMRFQALVGVLPHERVVPQPVEVDVTVRVEADGFAVDYRALYAAAATIVSPAHVEYLETIADRIAAAALALDRRIRAARVSVRKPHVALPGPLAYAQVTVERTADD